MTHTTEVEALAAQRDAALTRLYKVLRVLAQVGGYLTTEQFNEIRAARALLAEHGLQAGGEDLANPGPVDEVHASCTTEGCCFGDCPACVMKRGGAR